MMRPTSNGQTARDVRASARTTRDAKARLLEMTLAEYDRRTAACLEDTLAFLAALGLPKPPASDGACAMCGREDATVMVDDTCSRCWRGG